MFATANANIGPSGQTKQIPADHLVEEDVTL